MTAHARMDCMWDPSVKWSQKGDQMGESIPSRRTLDTPWRTIGAPIRFSEIEMYPVWPRNATRSWRSPKKWSRRTPRVSIVTQNAHLGHWPGRLREALTIIFGTNTSFGWKTWIIWLEPMNHLDEENESPGWMTCIISFESMTHYHFVIVWDSWDLFETPTCSSICFSMLLSFI